MLNNYKSYLWNEFIIYNIPHDSGLEHKIFYNTKNHIYTASKIVESPEDYKDCDIDCIGFHYHIENQSFKTAKESLAFIRK